MVVIDLRVWGGLMPPAFLLTREQWPVILGSCSFGGGTLKGACQALVSIRERPVQSTRAASLSFPLARRFRQLGAGHSRGA